MKSNEIEINTKKVTDEKSVTLIEKGTPEYTVVYSDTVGHMNGEMARRLCRAVKDITDIELPTLTREEAAGIDTPRIILESTALAETEKYCGFIQPEGYAIDFAGEDIVIFAWTAEAMEKAILTFSQMISTDGEATFVVTKEENITVGSTDSAYYKDIPFEVGGRAVDSIYDSSNNTMVLYWADIAQTAFEEYTEKLDNLGFVRYQSLENESVAAVTYTKDNASVHVYYLKRVRAFRVVTQPNAELPVNPYGYDKICNAAVTQIGLDYSDPRVVGGMGYLIRLEDGTFVVVDGGWNASDAKILYDLMLEQKPEGVDELVITAWFITHAHIDHCGVYNNFALKYQDKATVKMLIGNDASEYIHSTLDNPGHIFAHAKKYKDFSGCINIKAHTGQKFYFPGVTMTMLFSHEDIYPNHMFEINSAATTCFDAVINKDNTRFFFLADVTEEGAGYLVRMYSEDIKCDVLQIGHHGNKGGNYDLYSLCAPRLAFWPARAEYPDRPHIVIQPQNKWIFEHAEAVIRSGDGHYTVWFD